MNRNTEKWMLQLGLVIVSIGVAVAILRLLHRIAPPLLFWIFVLFFLQSAISNLVRLWMTRPGHTIQEPPIQWTPPTPQNPLKRCAHCGAAVAGSDRYCPTCGQPTEPTTQEEG